MSCLTCSSFDPNYHGGYCDFHRCNTTPSGDCDHEDKKGGGFTYHPCSECNSFDPYHLGGYCDFHRKGTYPSSSCSDFGWI